MSIDTTIDIRDLDEQERQLLLHTLAAIRRSRTEGLHFFSNFLGIQWEAAAGGQSRLRMPIGPQIYNTRGAAQGGAVATLADLALAAAIRSQLPPDLRLVTVEMKVHYLRPGRGSALVAEGECVYLGKRLGVAEARIVDDQGQMVALATGTFAVVRPPREDAADPGEPHPNGAPS